MTSSTNDEKREERGIRPTASESAELRRREQLFGIYVLSRDIGISKDGAARACAGLPLYPATLSAVRRYLKARR